MRMHEQDQLLSLCRAVMPGVAGVVLSTFAGRVVAHEATRVQEPEALALEAARHAQTQTSALVPRPDGLYLVVFVPAPLAGVAGPVAA